MKRLIILASSFLALSLGSTAFAGGFGKKTMRAPLSTSEVERSLLLSKGWIEARVDVQQKVSQEYWNSDGERTSFEHTTWTYRTERIRLTMGYGNRGELWFSIPIHQAALTQQRDGVADADQVNITDASMGDPMIGWKYKLFENPTPMTSAILDIWYKGPAGNEAPGTNVGGPNNVGRFIFTTGTPDLYMGLAGKQQFGPMALTVTLGYKHRFSNTVHYLTELENLQFVGRISPGNEFNATGNLVVQAGPLNFRVGAVGAVRGETRVGTTSGGFVADRNCDDKEADLRRANEGCLYPLVGSDGANLDLVAGIELIASRGVELGFNAIIPLAGEDLMFFPIEDLHPTAGITLGGTLEVRY